MTITLPLFAAEASPDTPPSPLVVGVTGARGGAPHPQHFIGTRVLMALRECGATEGHHGDCEGWDAEMHRAMRAMFWRVVGHPPTNPKHRAWCVCDELRPELPYLERNDHIALADVLVAGPAHPEHAPESKRSGTWHCVRCARRRGRPVVIIHASGTAELERCPEWLRRALHRQGIGATRQVAPAARPAAKTRGWHPRVGDRVRLRYAAEKQRAHLAAALALGTTWDLEGQVGVVEVVGSIERGTPTWSEGGQVRSETVKSRWNFEVVLDDGRRVVVPRGHLAEVTT